MSDVGYASLQIIPSAKDFASKLNSQIQGPLAQSGGAAGASAGGSFAKSFAKVAAGVAVAGSAALVAFATKSADTFSRVGGEVTKLSRATGLAAQDASRLRFAGEESGIGIDAMTKSLGVLSKAVVNGKTLDKLGIQLKDTHGKALPLNTDLLNIAKRFQSMPDGIEKNALALKLFGRSGADLIPFLNKGADGIAELEKQSDKFGQTLSGSDLAAVKASTIAHREFSAAMDGLQIQVGRYVLPIITKFVTFTTSALIPAIHGAADIASRYLAPAFDFAFGIVDGVMSKTVGFVTNVLVPGIKAGIDRIVAIVTPFADKARDAFDRIRSAVDDKLTPALRDRLEPVLDRLVKKVTGNLVPALAGVGVGAALALGTQMSSLAGSVGSVILTVKELSLGWGSVIVGLALVAAGFAYAYQHSETFRIAVQKVVAGVKQAFELLFHGKFTGGPFAPDSPFVVDLLKFRAFVIDKVIPVLHQIADFVQGHLKQVLIGVGAVVLGLISPWALVAAAIVGLYLKSETFRDVIAKVASFLQTTVAPAIATFAGHVADVFGALVGFVRDRWAAISEAITHVVNFVRDVITIAVNVISALWRAWGDDLFHLALEAFGAIRDSIENALTVVRGIIDVVLSLINGDWGKAWDGVKEILSGVWSEIGNEAGFALDALKALIGGVLSTIAQVWNGVWGELAGVVSAAWSQITGIVVSSVAAVVGLVSSLRDSVTTLGSGLWDVLGAGLDAVVEGIIAGLQPVITLINAAISAYNLLPFHKDVKSISLGTSAAKGSDPTGAGRTAARGGGSATALAAGAVVKHVPGGVLANIGEGRHDEAVVPLSKASLAPLAAAMAPMLETSDRGPSVVNVYPSAGMDEEALAKAVVKQFARRAKSDGPFLTKIGAA